MSNNIQTQTSADGGCEADAWFAEFFSSRFSAVCAQHGVAEGPVTQQASLCDVPAAVGMSACTTLHLATPTKLD